VSRERVILGRRVAEDEIDLESGFLMVPTAIPEALATPVTPQPPAGIQPPAGPAAGTEAVCPPLQPPPPTGRRTRVTLAFEATREQIYKAFPAIANLADKSDGGKVRLRVEGVSSAGYDPTWLRNAVEEPLDEADIARTAEE